MAGDRRNPHLRQRRLRNGNKHDVKRGGGHARAHQDARDRDERQRKEELQVSNREQLKRTDRNEIVQRSGHGSCALRDHEADPEADAGSVDDADHDADGGAGGAYRQGVFHAELQRGNHFGNPDPLLRIEGRDDRRGNQHEAHRQIEPAVGVFPDDESDERQRESKRKRLFPPRHARDHGQGNPAERRHVRRVAGEQDDKQADQGDHVRPAVAPDRSQLRQGVLRKPLQVQPPRHQVNDREHADIVQKRGNDRGDHDRRVRHLQELRHYEGGRPHDRRRDLPAGGGGRFDASGEVPRIAEPLHVGNREAAGGNGVRHRRARNGSEKRRGHDRHLGGPAGIAPRQNCRVVDEQLAQAGALGNHAEQDEVEHDRGNDPQRDSEDPFLREVHAADERVEIHARVLEDSGEYRPEQRVRNEHQNDGRKNPAERPAGQVQHEHDQRDAQDHVVTVGIAHPEGLLLDAQPLHAAPREAEIEGCRDSQDHEHDVVDGNVSDAHRARPHGVGALGLEKREQGVGKDEKPGEMDPHVPVVHRQAEARSQEMVDREHNRDCPQSLPDTRPDSARRGALVVFPFDRSEFLGLRPLIAARAVLTHCRLPGRRGGACARRTETAERPRRAPPRTRNSNAAASARISRAGCRSPFAPSAEFRRRQAFGGPIRIPAESVKSRMERGRRAMPASAFASPARKSRGSGLHHAGFAVELLRTRMQGDSQGLHAVKRGFQSDLLALRMAVVQQLAGVGIP